MKKIVAIFLILTAVFIATASAEIALEAEVDKKSVNADDTLTYKITVISTEKGSPQLILPKLEGFKVISQAQSSTVSFVADALKTHFSYVLILSPVAAGKLTIGPTQLKTKSGMLATKAFEIEITPAKQLSPPSTEETPPLPDNRIRQNPEVTL